MRIGRKNTLRSFTDDSSVWTVCAAWQYVPAVFRTQNAVKLTPQNIKDMINSDVKRTDKKGNIIRASDNTKAKKAHMDELARKKIMGHEIVDVTDKHYTHFELDEYLMAEIMKIE